MQLQKNKNVDTYLERDKYIDGITTEQQPHYKKEINFHVDDIIDNARRTLDQSFWSTKIAMVKNVANIKSQNVC